VTPEPVPITLVDLEPEVLLLCLGHER